MGFIVGAPVDDRAVGCRHLHHGAVVILSKGIGRQIRGPHIFRRVDQAAGIRLAGEINSRLIPESKDRLVFGKHICPLHGAHAHHGHIAGLHQRFRHAEASMAAPGVGRAFDGPAAHFQVAAAVKIFISRQNSFFQARGHSEDLLG